MPCWAAESSLRASGRNPCIFRRRMTYYPRSFIQAALAEPYRLLLVVFFAVCTLSLVWTRIRACFQPREATVCRDLALLFSGPVIAVLYFLMKASVAARSLEVGGIDAEFPLIYFMREAEWVCGIALFCFVLGVIACALPAKRRLSLDPGPR